VRLYYFIMLVFVVCTPAHGRVFTSTDGTVFLGELTEVNDESVVIIRYSDRRKFSVEKTKFVEGDRAYFDKWIDLKSSSTASKKWKLSRIKMPTRNRKVVSFIDVNMGKKVGDGDCWDLAHYAMRAAGGKRPRGKIYVWGSELDLSRKQPLPGDIIQTYKKGQAPEGKHTMVIYKIHENSGVTVAEQNWNKKLYVTTRNVDLKKLGSQQDLHVYRLR